MEDFIEKLVVNGGSLMGSYQIVNNELILTSYAPAVTGKIIIDDEKMAYIDRTSGLIRLDYGKVEVLFIASRANKLVGSFTAGIMDIIIRGDRKEIASTIIHSLRRISLQKA